LAVREQGETIARDQLQYDTAQVRDETMQNTRNYNRENDSFYNGREMFKSFKKLTLISVPVPLPYLSRVAI
jgi:uncharacterized MAPEG superfamily protein